MRASVCKYCQSDPSLDDPGGRAMAAELKHAMDLSGLLKRPREGAAWDLSRYKANDLTIAFR